MPAFFSRIPTKKAITFGIAVGFVAASGLGPLLLRAQSANTANPSAETTGVTDKEILIGSCTSLEGPLALVGQDQLLGARTYFSYINDAGGVNGRKIRIVAHNDSYEGEKAYGCWQQLLKDGPFAGAFFVGAATSGKYIPLAESSHVPALGFLTGAKLVYEPVHPHCFALRASYDDEINDQITHLCRDAGVTRVGIIYQDDAFGQSVVTALRNALQKFHLEPAALGAFRRNTFDVDGAIKDVRAAKPQVVVMAGYYPPLAEIVKRSHSRGWNPLFSMLGVGTAAFVKAAGKDANGIISTQVFRPYQRDDLPTIALYKRLLKKYQPGHAPDYVSLEGFVDAMVLTEGLKKAGKELTRPKLIAALESMHDLDVGLGNQQRVTFSSSDHKGFDAVYATMVKDGQTIPLTDWGHLKAQIK